jgi:transposase
MPLSNSPLWSTRPVVMRSFCSMQMKPSSGVLPCRGRAGGAKPSGIALPTRPLSPSQIKCEEALKRQAWRRYRSWSRVTRGVLLSVIGAVQYGTTKVFYKVVPHFETEGFRQYIHQIMALFGHTGKEVVMVVDRSGIHRAHKLASTLAHWHEQFRLHFLPARCGHHLNPMEGFWRVMKDRIGAGRCLPDLQQRYHRTRQVLMAHHERPIYAFHWSQIPSRT